MLRSRKHVEEERSSREEIPKPILVQTLFPAPYRVAVFDRLSRGHQLFVVFERSFDIARNNEWFVFDFSFESVTLSSKGGRKRYWRELRRLRAYACVLVYEYATPGSILLMIRCLWVGIPYAINCDGAVPRPRRLRDLVKRYFIQRASVCLAGSQSAVEYFRAYGAIPSQIHRHPFTSLAADDVFSAPPGHHERARLRDELGLPSDKMVFASVGNFIPRKGFDVLLEAWLQIPPDAHLVIIGEGPLEPMYRSFIATNRLSNVTIVPFQRPEALRAYYRATDVFVLATREDVWGLVVNEAMSCGLPVITTDQCMAGVELIGDSAGGFIVPSERPDLLIEALRSTLEMNQSERADLGRRNLDTISRYTYEAVATAHDASIALLQGS